MNLGEAKNRAIKAINEWSNNGTLIIANNNADYTLRLNSFADYAQNEMSDHVGIDASYIINDDTTVTTTENGYKKYNLPTTYKEHRYVLWNDEMFSDYRIVERQFWISENYTGTFTLFHHKYPTEITDTTADSYEFEVDAYTHSVIPYYLGGMVIADENSEISNKLLNIYYERLNKLVKRKLHSPKTVRITQSW